MGSNRVVPYNRYVVIVRLQGSHGDAHRRHPKAAATLARDIAILNQLCHCEESATKQSRWDKHPAGPHEIASLRSQ